MRIRPYRAIMWLAAVFVVSAAIICGALVYGVAVYRVTTGSMEPDLPAGTIIVVSGKVPIEPHRAISFTADEGTVTHVLVGFRKDGSLITRGIANPVNDNWTRPVLPRDVRGRVVATVTLFSPGFWTSPRGHLALAGLGLVAGALVAGRLFLASPVPSRRATIRV